MAKKKDEITIRSSAAEYLTYVASVGDQQDSIEMHYEEDSTIRNFRIVQTEGSRQVTRDTKHYNLQMIVAVGFKVNNERADAEKSHMELTTWAAVSFFDVLEFLCGKRTLREKC